MQVSILTTSEEVVQRLTGRETERWFQVSILTTSEEVVQLGDSAVRDHGVVSILTTSEEVVQRVKDGITELVQWFQSSPPPKRWCNIRDHVVRSRFGVISILTTSEEVVQPNARLAHADAAQGVSILTTSEEVVQPGDS